MERCPICRATLNGADVCRRCRAELRNIQEVERRGQDLVGAAMYRLASGNFEAADRLLQRALVIHATPTAQMLWRLVESYKQQPENELSVHIGTVAAASRLMPWTSTAQPNGTPAQPEPAGQALSCPCKIPS